MPLPLPVMIPFMMWQSAAIAAGFGTYFQFAKRKVSAMSNDEFNKSNPHELVAALYDDIVENIPSSFKQIESLTPIILDSMLKMLTDAAQWFSAVLGGQGGFADIQHHLQGLPGHIGHAGFGEELPGGDTGGDTGTDLPKLLTLSLSEISAASDLVLAAWIRNINDYTISTQDRLIAEKNRRERTDEGDKEEPTKEQQTTQLDPNFVATLNSKDLEIGGARVRNYKGVLQKWFGIRKITWSLSSKQFRTNKWIGHWEQLGTGHVGTESQAVASVNVNKGQVGASYVLEFKIGTSFTWYLIKDNF